MTPRERFLATMRYESVDRAPFRDGGAWPETIERWKREGYTPGGQAFDFDRWEGFGHWFFPHPPFEKTVTHEDDRSVTFINHEGILMRERRDHPLSSMPQFLRFPVETPEDFRSFRKERLQPDLDARIGPDWKERLEAYRTRDFPLVIIADRWGGFFGPLRNLLGVEKLCILFHENPSFVEEMMDAIADFIIAMMDQVLDRTSVEFFGFWEDMAYKNGPLIGPQMVRKYMVPRYKRVTEFLRGRGVEFISVDSDGDVSLLVPHWLDAGINIVYPFEVQCGMDVAKFRKEYGRDLRMCTGINKRAIAEGPTAIEAELARVAPLIAEGGYIPGPDHSLPPDVSFAQYLYFNERLFELLESLGN
jgi:uroporphyrinogen decarboxylase